MREYNTTGCTVFVVQNRSRELVAESKGEMYSAQGKTFDSLLTKVLSVRPLNYRLNPHYNFVVAMTPIPRPLSRMRH